MSRLQPLVHLHTPKTLLKPPSSLVLSFMLPKPLKIPTSSLQFLASSTVFHNFFFPNFTAFYQIDSQQPTSSQKAQPIALETIKISTSSSSMPCQSIFLIAFCPRPANRCCICTFFTLPNQLPVIPSVTHAVPDLPPSQTAPSSILRPSIPTAPPQPFAVVRPNSPKLEALLRPLLPSCNDLIEVSEMRWGECL